MTVLNMANAYNPGGGYRSGAGAQEENLHRRTDLRRFLNRKFYPIDKPCALISKDVTVFRGPESEGYPFLKVPFKVNVVSCAATSHPNLVQIKGPRGREEPRLADDAADVMKSKVHAILLAAARSGCDTLVLSAFGCGAFANPPTHVASLFRGAIEEHFRHSFKHISFSVIEDHNSWRPHNPYGNLRPFEYVLNDLAVSPEEDARHKMAEPDVEPPSQPRE